jgi:hypothetical protein
MSSEIKIALIRARFAELSKQRAKAVEKVADIEQSMNSLIDQMIEEGVSDDDAEMLEESVG